MRNFTQSLCELVQEGLVSRDVAMDYAPNREALKMLASSSLQGMSIVNLFRMGPDLLMGRFLIEIGARISLVCATPKSADVMDYHIDRNLGEV